MNKQEFLTDLRNAISGLPSQDIDERIAFYDEMIDDMIEEGASEEEVIANIGSVNEIATQIVAETPITKIVKERIKPKRRLKTWEIILIVLGFPLWLPLLIAAFAVVLSLYIVLWSLIISLWAIELSFVVCALGCLVLSVVLFIQGKPILGVAAFGVGILCIGISIFMFFACIAASKGIIHLTKKIALGIKSMFLRKESTK